MMEFSPSTHENYQVLSSPLTGGELRRPPAQAPPQRGFCPGGRASGLKRGGHDIFPLTLALSPAFDEAASRRQGRGN